MRPVLLLTLMACSAIHAQQYTLGVGVYPGDPRETFAPVTRLDRTYRNLALHRPAYQSSSYDYNLTTQLITDGVKDTKLPRWVAVSTSQGELKKNEREWLLDRNWVTTVDLDGSHGWVQIGLGGGDVQPEVDRVAIQVTVGQALTKWTGVVTGSDDGKAWLELGRATDSERWGKEFEISVPLTAPSRSRFYRVDLEAADSRHWRVGEVAFFDRSKRLNIGGPYDFTSAWKSASAGEEWVYVDLGAVCEFDRVALDWREKSGDRILPAIYSDNYIALMPDESRTIRTELEDADTRGERPKIAIE